MTARPRDCGRWWLAAITAANAVALTMGVVW